MRWLTGCALRLPMPAALPPYAAEPCCWRKPGCWTAGEPLPHWKLLDTLQAEFPQVRVEGGPLYIQDEHIWTSGGSVPASTLTLALVEEDYGFSLARDIAQDFVMYLRRPGGQLQFSRYNLSADQHPGPH
ncbi:transcriptional regulator [Klebsiella michiganensis]|uniref:Transcriptional regulator n=1 Tax=Klebsiella michiganensis TaxID=1134687 RepID=A0A7H4LTQ9_9ENTR|nr:transcriptional regulator [Klebsiella michiganensis]